MVFRVEMNDRKNDSDLEVQCETRVGFLSRQEQLDLTATQCNMVHREPSEVRSCFEELWEATPGWECFHVTVMYCTASAVVSV